MFPRLVYIHMESLKLETKHCLAKLNSQKKLKNLNDSSPKVTFHDSSNSRVKGNSTKVYMLPIMLQGIVRKSYTVKQRKAII